MEVPISIVDGEKLLIYMHSSFLALAVNIGMQPYL